MFLFPIYKGGLDNTIPTAGTNGIRNQLYLFSGKRVVPESKILKKKRRMQVLL
jgi:hypothetical protein